MRVADIQLQMHAHERELSAVVDGFRLWYRFPAGCPLSSQGDAFVAAALLPAMRAGETLEIEGAPVSPMLLRGVARIQDIIARWDPRCRRVEVHADSAVAETVHPGVASFFSGGIDGTYTLSRHLDEISHLIFIKGVDIQVDNDALFAQALQSNQRFATSFGKTLLPVATNIRRFCHPRGLAWNDLYGGSGLASVALALGFARVYEASSYSYEDLHPYGSHPLLDPLWSNEATTLIHDGCEAGRADKLRAIAQVPGALDLLRVCWQDAGYNCGRCEKCLRTMLALRLLDLHTPTFPPLDNLDAVRRLRIHTAAEVMRFAHHRELAVEVGDVEVAEAIEYIERRYRIRHALVELDAALLRSRGKRVMQKVTAWRH